MARFPLVPTAPEPERAILVGVEWRDNAWPLDRSLDELERLAHTAGAQCVARLSQRLVKPYPKSYIGSGKDEELCGLVHRMDADVVIFDDDLTPSQQSYLEKAVGEPVKIIDRTALILDIFGLHALPREGRLQVQLAQLQYLLPRLRGMWSRHAMAQQRGGLGVQRGGAGFVGHQAGVDRNVQPRRLERGFAEQRGAPGVGEGQHAALGRIFLCKGDPLAARGYDLQRHRTGPVEGLFQHRSLVGVLLRRLFGQLVGGSQRQESLGVGRYQPLQPLAQGGGALVQRKDVGFYGGLFLLAHGQAADHIPQRRPRCAHQCRRAAAARCGGDPGKLSQKGFTAQICQCREKCSPLLHS